MKAILVSELQNLIISLRTDIDKEKNPKAKARLVEEQAAYKLTLRNLKQHKVKLTPYAGKPGYNPETGRRMRNVK